MLYSPRIKDDLIHRIWQLGRHQEKTMTKVVDDILRPALERLGENGIFKDIEAEERAMEALTRHLKSLIESRKTKTAEVIELLRRVA